MTQKDFVLTNIRATLIAVLAIILPLERLEASGACCTVSLSERNKPAVTLIASTGWSHEHIAGTTYDFRQHALIGKGLIPLGGGLFLTGQIGLPLRTELNSTSVSYQGTLGYLYGIGFGGILPSLLPSVNIYGSVNYTRSIGTLNQTTGRQLTDASFVISEVQGILMGEYEVSADASFYGGARFYSGRNRIQDETNNLTHSGEREGSVGPFLGIRHSVWEGVSLVGEGSFGHIRIVSLALNLTM